MFSDFFVVVVGILFGTMSGLLPGIGTSISLIISTPFLIQLEIHQMFLFYMAILSTAQYTGTIPSIFLNIPGESNSMPAVIEGSKFRRRKLSSLAIGLCAVGSLFGSLIAIILTLAILPIAIEGFKIFLQDNFKILLFAIVFGAGMFAFNNKKFLLNGSLLVLGYFLSMIGIDDINGVYRYTAGIESLENGIPFYPLIIAVMVSPILSKTIIQEHNMIFVKEKITSFYKVFVFFLKNIKSAIRGAVIGFFSALAPGFGTLLSSNASYAVESKIQKNYPAKKILSSETANNSGGLALILPFVLIGIPLTGSEFILYNYLVEAGWSPFQFENLEQNAVMLMYNLVPWFVFVNFIALIIAWPLAKTMITLMTKMKGYLNFFIAGVCIATTVYLGIDNYQLGYYLTCLVLFSIITIKLRKINFTPVLFSYILGTELEFVLTRYLVIWTQ